MLKRIEIILRGYPLGSMVFTALILSELKRKNISTNKKKKEYVG